MTIINKNFFLKSACLMTAVGLCMSAPVSSHAKDNDVIHLLVPFPPGGQGDLVARFVANELANRMQKKVVVENKPGANTIVAAQALARSPADGSYLMLTSDATLVTNPHLYKNLSYKPSDFVPISRVVDLPLVLIASTTTKPSNAKEVIEAAKQEPKKYTFGSIGVGSTQQLGMELFKSMAQIEINHIPYGGGAPAMNDVSGGRINYFLAGLRTASNYIDSKKAKPIGLTGGKQTDLLPGVPTISESGLPGFEMSAWLGVLAPAKLSPELVQKFQTQLVNIAKDEKLQEKWHQLGGIPIGSTSDEFKEFIKKDSARWEKVIKSAGIKSE